VSIFSYRCLFAHILIDWPLMIAMSTSPCFTHSWPYPLM